MQSILPGDVMFPVMAAVDAGGMAMLMSSGALGVGEKSGGVLFRLSSYSFCHCWFTFLLCLLPRLWLFSVAGLPAPEPTREL